MALNTVGSAATPPNLGSGVLFYPDNARPRLFDISGGEDIHAGNFTVAAGVLSSVSGRVNFRDPKASFWLALAPVEQPALAAAVAVTESDGSFRFKGVPAGSYYLFASGPGRGRNQGGALENQASFWRSRLDVAGQDTADIAVTPEQGGAVKVLLRIARSTSSGPEASCPATAQVRLTSVEDWGSTLTRDISASVVKDTAITDVGPSKYVATVPGLKDGCYASATPVLDLSNGGSGAILEVSLTPGGSIHGTVHSDAQIVADSIVVLLADASPNLQLASPDADAHFSFSGLRPGKYRIAVRPVHSHWISDPAQMLELDVPGGRSIEIDLAAPAKQ
jgi:hypothetical protein